MFLIMPSICYENNPLSVIEAFALGKPVVGARIGGIPELVRDWETGLTYTSGDVNDLGEKIRVMFNNRDKIAEMGQKARSYVEREFNSSVYYVKLIEIYEKARKRVTNVKK
jgi:glycosyltransferase involved in cell wall biosynthesis